MPLSAVSESTPNAGLEKQLKNITVWMQEISQNLVSLGSKIDSFRGTPASTNGYDVSQVAASKFAASNMPVTGIKQSCGVGEIDMLDMILQKQTAVAPQAGNEPGLVDVVERLKRLDVSNQSILKGLNQSFSKDLVDVVERLKRLEISVNTVNRSVNQPVTQARSMSAPGNQPPNKAAMAEQLWASPTPPAPAMAEQLQRLEQGLNQLLSCHQLSTVERQHFPALEQQQLAVGDVEMAAQIRPVLSNSGTHSSVPRAIQSAAAWRNEVPLSQPDANELDKISGELTAMRRRCLDKDLDAAFPDETNVGLVRAVGAPAAFDNSRNNSRQQSEQSK